MEALLLIESRALPKKLQQRLRGLQRKRSRKDRESQNHKKMKRRLLMGKKNKRVLQPSTVSRALPTQLKRVNRRPRAVRRNRRRRKTHPRT